jgi:hypothetical protein
MAAADRARCPRAAACYYHNRAGDERTAQENVHPGVHRITLARDEERIAPDTVNTGAP